VPDNHEAVAGKILEQFPELAGVEAGTQEWIDANFLLQIFAGNFSRLTRAWKRTRDDGRRDLEPGQ
jgi:hypothetical protein